MEVKLIVHSLQSLMSLENSDPIISRVMTERMQGHDTRKSIFLKLEEQLGRPVVSFFTSFKFPVSIGDDDADMLEAVLQKIDLSKGLVLFISSPGGDGLAAERIINVCRSYSGTGEYWAIVPGKAKSAATMVCFGASKIIMGGTSELGPVDPQMAISAAGTIQRFSVYNIVESYDELFAKAVSEQGNLEPYLQQLANYDERGIRELRSAISLAEDIAVTALVSGMLAGSNFDDVRDKIKIFLTPETTKMHGRPIYWKDASDCGLKIQLEDVKGGLWQMAYELYIRTNEFVSSRAAKCFESKEHSFYVAVQMEES